MVSISMIDIVTVVFREELPVLKLQAESIDLYCNKVDFGNIYVIVNDDDLDLSEIDRDWWGAFSDRVVFMHRRAWNIEYATNGWLTQQLLKLLGAAYSFNTWTMVLDAKTILAQPVDLKKLFDDYGLLTWGYSPVIPVFEPSRQIVSKLFDIDLQSVAGPAGIPFFFKNSLVQEMIQEVESRTGQSFAEWFQQTGMVTEFILYSGYIQYRFGNLGSLYTNNYQSYKVCNICHSEVESFDRKFQDMLDSNILTVSIHRNAWPKLTEDQKNKYRNLLTKFGVNGQELQ